MAKRNLNKKYLRSLFGLLVICLATAFVALLSSFKWNDVLKVANIGDAGADVDAFPMAVYFFDVGHADSIYIRCESINMIIDAGDYGNTKAADFLKRREVNTLDLVVATHPHSDHIGGMTHIINNFGIKQFFMPTMPDSITPTTKTYEFMLLALKNKQTPIRSPSVKEKFSLKSLDVEILAPKQKYKKVNNNSIVLSLKYGQRRFLFMGDAEKESEADILDGGGEFDLHADVLKVGHHGSATSTTKKFLKEVSPEYAIISVGESTSHLPKASVINSLNEQGVKTYRTDISGTVVVATDGDQIKVQTAA